MKAEEKILELLAEYLKKTDQTLERMDLAYDVLIKHSEGLMKHSEELIDLRKVSEKNQNEIAALRKESIKHEIQQEVLLKEILSISRRVGNLEDNR
ncbi:MAG: hypothetical protein AABY93_02425 [Bacteroidota bacterium]